jgi:hypothetical protein
MAKPILLRKSFNSGELSPELWYRDDLAANVKGCKHLTNFVPTPYGAATRRPPMELLAKIRTDLFGVPVRYIPFKFSLTEVFHIVFTDGSGSESVDPTTADLIIFNANGSQVIFDGSPAPLSVLPAELPAVLSTGVTAMATTVYDPADLHEIHYINVNDFVYLTCGGKYPVQVINRFFDEAEQGNRWKFEPFEITGLLGDTNLDTSSTLYLSGDKYDASTTYSEGAVVGVGSNDIAITATSWKNNGYHHIVINEYLLKITVASGTYSVGQTVTVEGLFINFVAGNQTYYSDYETREVYRVGDVISGAYSIIAVSGTTLTLNVTGYWQNQTSQSDMPKFDLTNATASILSGVAGTAFYRSLQDGNTGNALTNGTWWEALNWHSGLLRCESSVDLFKLEDVGREIAIKPAGKQTLGNAWNVDATSGAINAYGTVEMTTEGGVWGGVLTLQSSTNAGLTWDDLKSIESNDGSSNGSVEVEITEINTIIRVVLDWKSGTNLTKCKWKVELKDEVRNHARIVNYIDPRTVTVEAITPFKNEVSDYRYALGEFSGTTGYPFSLTVHDERLCLGGSRAKPNTVFASRVNDWNNYLRGITDTAPYTFTVASDSFDTIRSLKSSRQLNVLTDNQEVTMGSREDSEVTSVTNIAVSSHTNYGSSNVQAVQMADMIWFCMGQSERVRASRYDFASDGQQSIEMSLFASHVTESGIKEMSFRRHPYNSLFCLLNNGTACTLTYEGMQEIKAWATVVTSGDIISAAANYSDEGDIVAGVVKRGDDYFLEVFGSIEDDTVFLDNSTTWVDEDFNIGVPIKQTDDGGLTVVHDDVELTEGVDYTITAGVLQIPSVISGRVTVGRKYESRLNPTDPAEVTPSGQVKRLTALGLYLKDSGTCRVFINGKESAFSDGLKWGAGQRESGLFDMETGGDWDQGLDVDVKTDGHRHLTVLGLGYRLSVSQG